MEAASLSVLFTLNTKLQKNKKPKPNLTNMASMTSLSSVVAPPLPSASLRRRFKFPAKYLRSPPSTTLTCHLASYSGSTTNQDSGKSFYLFQSSIGSFTLLFSCISLVYSFTFIFLVIGFFFFFFLPFSGLPNRAISQFKFGFFF